MTDNETIIDYETEEVLLSIPEFDPDDKMALALIHDARTAIENTRDVFEVKNIISISKAAAAFYAAQGMEENAQVAREASLWAQRKAGEFLKEIPKNKGAAEEGWKETQFHHGTTFENTPTLADLDIDKHESFRWQLLADVPEKTFQEYIDEKLARGYELTTGGLIKIGRQYRSMENKTEDPPLPEGKYSVIYADPPWRYDFSLSDSRKVENQYPTMEVVDICNLPIMDIVSENCVLFLWATNPKLREALRVIEEWGFEYKTSMVWVKDKIGMGYYARQQHELLLIATYGNPVLPKPNARPSSVITGDRTKHSHKPTMAYEVIEQMYPEYKKIELFSRTQRDGWETWGNERL